MQMVSRNDSLKLTRECNPTHDTFDRVILKIDRQARRGYLHCKIQIPEIYVQDIITALGGMNYKTTKKGCNKLIISWA